MLRAVLVPMLLAQVFPYPLQRPHLHLTQKRSEEVFWGQCSPRFMWVRPEQDSWLHCEMMAPSGSVLTWYKDHEPVYPQQARMSNSVLSQPKMLTKGKSKVRVQSLIFLDCISQKDLGDYTLRVETPSGKVYERNFTLTFLNEHPSRGGTCGVVDHIPYLPRIYQHASQALAHTDHDIILPCRFQGTNVISNWYLHGTLLKNNDKYKVLRNGDLMVKNVRQKDLGLYRCEVASTLIRGLTDQVTTFLYPMP